MWTCKGCQEAVDESFDVCWNCGATKEGAPDPSFQRVLGAAGTSSAVASETAEGANVDDRDPIACPRCREALAYVGRKQFHEGTNWGVLGEVGELFVKREHFDVYVCPRCGRVEFFVDGIGEQYRPQ